MVEVIINGTKIDLISEGVKYTRQANDLADISTVNASYTYSLRADKTPKNTRLFEGLGLVGDTSNTPYVKNTTQLIDNGSVLIEKGLATVKETNEEYKLFIQDGIIEVFKLIENRSLGYDLEISELEHSKNAATIIGSWGNGTPYRYLIADYNGKTQDLTGIDAAYQIPSVSVKYLWDKVFDFLGYTYSGDFAFIENKWITYPKPPEVEEEDITEILNISRGKFLGRFPTEEYKKWNTPTVQGDISIINNWKIRTNITGNYKITFDGGGAAEIETYRNSEIPFMIRIFVNGKSYSYIMSDNPEVRSFDVFLPADSIIELKIEVDTSAIDGPYTLEGIVIEYLNLKIETTSRENIDFRSVLGNFSIKDFFKEIMFRGALTPFVDNIEKHIDFLSLKERLNTTNVNDLSKKFVRRINESYTFGTYAQRNLLTLKYNTAEENYHDGSLYVSNANLDEKKTLFESKFYTSEKDQVEINFTDSSSGFVPVIKLWEKEIKEEADGAQEIKYKPLNNRFYYLSAKTSQNVINVNGTQSIGFFIASTNGTTMPEVLISKYNESNKIFTDTRIHEVELLLSAYDFQSLELEKLVYLEQEAQFYVLNKVIWESGELAIAELLRVKKETISTVNPQPQLT